MTPHFHVLQFSPKPEFREFVNVGLVVYDERPRIFYDNTFRKLKCVDPSFDSDTLRLWFAALEKDIDNMRGVHGEPCYAAASGTSQMKLGESCALTRGVSTDIIHRLIEYYLERPKATTEKGIAKAERTPRVEGLLDRFLISTARIAPVRLLRHAEPRTFLTEPVARELGQNGLKVSRVASGRTGLVLIDGVNLAMSERRVERRVQEVGYTFYRIGEIREVIQRREKREVTTASVIFNGERATRDSRMKYLVHELERESSIRIFADRPENQGRLRDALNRAGLPDAAFNIAY